MKLKLEIFADDYPKADRLFSNWLSYIHLHSGLAISRHAIDMNPIRFADPETKQKETKFKAEVQINSDDPSDSRLHSLIRQLPDKIEVAGPINPTIDPAHKTAIRFGKAAMQERAMSLSGYEPGAVETAALNIGRKKLKEWGMDAGPDPAERPVFEMSLARKHELHLADPAGEFSNQKDQPISAERRRELGIE